LVVKASSRWKDIPTPTAFHRELSAIKAEKREAGMEILDLTEGDPVIYGHVNQPLSDRLVEAAEGGWHMYPEQSPWKDELRKAISIFEKNYRNINYDSEDIIIGPGVAGCFNNI